MIHVSDYVPVRFAAVRLLLTPIVPAVTPVAVRLVWAALAAVTLVALMAGLLTWVAKVAFVPTTDGEVTATATTLVAAMLLAVTTAPVQIMPPVPAVRAVAVRAAAVKFA